MLGYAVIAGDFQQFPAKKTTDGENGAWYWWTALGWVECTGQPNDSRGLPMSGVAS